MAAPASSASALSFSGDTFAKLAPGHYLQAHLRQSSSLRPNSRQPTQFRTPTINTGSLSHANGSAVVRLGDTAVVCGIRGEILLASDIPRPVAEAGNDNALNELGLLVPNLELSTGCSPAHLPGNPPGSQAQTLSYRILALLRETKILNLDNLRIEYGNPSTQQDGDVSESAPVTKAYWALYIDIMCLALDGNAFDAAWLAVVAALQNTRLPNAWWDPDREAILCSPLVAGHRKLALRSLPLSSTFAVYSTASPVKQREEADSWLLADPDAFEEALCNETISVVLSSAHASPGSFVKIEKSGGPVIGRELTARCIEAAKLRWDVLKASLAV